MKKNLKVLIIEDHPLIQEQIIKALQLLNEKQDTYYFKTIHKVDTLEGAYHLIYNNTLQEKCFYDILMLDIQLPTYAEKNLYSGEDFGIWLSTIYTTIPAIIVITAFTDGHRITNIIKTINPDGFIVKSDVDSTAFVNAIQQSIEYAPYYTTTVSNSMRKEITSSSLLDDVDRKLLFLLSNGATINEMVTMLPKSKSAIEKRKKRLMMLFGVKNSSTMELLRMARKKNFL